MAQRPRHHAIAPVPGAPRIGRATGTVGAARREQVDKTPARPDVVPMPRPGEKDIAGRSRKATAAPAAAVDKAKRRVAGRVLPARASYSRAAERDQPAQASAARPIDNVGSERPSGGLRQRALQTFEGKAVAAEDRDSATGRQSTTAPEAQHAGKDDNHGRPADSSVTARCRADHVVAYQRRPGRLQNRAQARRRNVSPKTQMSRPRPVTASSSSAPLAAMPEAHGKIRIVPASAATRTAKRRRCRSARGSGPHRRRKIA